MRRSHPLLLAIALIGSFAAAQASGEPSATYTVPEPIQRVDAVVNNFRKITVLTNDSERLNRISRERIEGVVWTLSQENRGRLSDIMETFADPAGHPLVTNVQAFFDKLDRPGLYNDCDYLAFEDLFEALFASRSQYPEDIRKRIDVGVFRIRKIKPYQVSDSRRNSKYQSPTAAPADAWGTYVSFLNQNYRREQLLKEYAAILPRR